MSTTTVRLPVEQRDTLEILARPDWAEAIREGLAAVDRGDTVPWRQKKRSGK